MKKQPFGRALIGAMILTTLLSTVLASPLLAAMYYMAPSGDDQNPGTEAAPWKTLAKANSTLQPGDTVYMRQGEYAGKQLKPAVSGEPDAYITYAAYPGESPVITSPGAVAAIDITNQSYIRINGITVDGKKPWPRMNVGRWFQLFNAHHIIIENSTFRYAGGWNCADIDQGSSYNIIRNNSFDNCGVWRDTNRQDSGDSLVITDAEHNLVEDNRFTRGGHNLINHNGRYNVIRNNYFDNTWGEGQGNRSLSMVSYTGTKEGGWTLFEGNVIANTLPASDNATPPAMKAEGFNYIIRRNFFVHSNQIGIQTHARVEDPTATLNKIFHNVFYDIGGSSWWLNSYVDIANPRPQGVYDNSFKNNIVYLGRQKPVNTSLDVDVRITLGRAGGGLQNNTVIANAFDLGSMITADGIGRFSLDWFEENHPQEVHSNLQIDNPGFISKTLEQPEDFRLAPDSPLIDKGVCLTRTTNSGAGTAIVVEDAGYFHDGFGIIEPDAIQVGANKPVQITKIDYATHTIIVAEPITWQVGDGVSLPYNGSSPDIGAWESEQ